MASLLVTGGAGFIGSHTVRQLAEAGEHIVVLDNMVHGHEDAVVHPSVELVVGDIGDAQLVETLFKAHDFEGVLHFAAWTQVGESMEQPLRYYQNNIAAPLVLLEVMKNHHARRFIFSSTAATYGNPQAIPMAETHPQEPINPYGMSKLMLERVLADCDAAWGLKHVILRYFNAGGSSADGLIGEDHDPETHLIPRVLMAVLGRLPQLTVFGDDYPTPDGSCIRDYIHVLDLASAHARALNYLRGGGSSTGCNLGTGIGVSVKEIIALAEEITGKPVPHVYGPRRAGDPPSLVADPSKAKAVLGWEAEHAHPRHMVEATWKWLTGPRGGRYGR